MRFFLEQLAEYQLQNNLTDLSKFCFVFPSRRAGVFFRQYLNDKTDKPLFSPEIITINDFFGKLEPHPVSDNISLVFKLYDSYRELINKEISLDEFIPWGEMCLADFDDIDKYLADPREVYSNLADQKALEDDFSHLDKDQIEAIRTFWSSFDPQKLSRLQQTFLEVWQKMPDLYHHFNARLDRDNETYEGKLYKTIAQKIKDRSIGELPYKHVVFAGLNALNTCEKRLLNYLKIKGMASFFWDYPQWIMESPFQKTEQGILQGNHEAARFIKNNLLDFPMPKDWENPQSKGPETITIATAANDLGQTQIGAKLLKEISHSQTKNQTTSNFPHARTALVLADETLMLPAIHSIPDVWQRINVTLGYPLKNTPAYGLVESLMTMQRSMRVTKQGKTWFYHRPLLALLRHQYISAILGEWGRKLVAKLIKANQIFIEKENIPAHDLLDKLLKKTDTSEDLTTYLTEVLQTIFHHLNKRTETSLEREFVYHLYLTIKRLGEILSSQTEKINAETWHRLFMKLADFQTVPFRGEPLSGLQVMGILETRVLDFDNLIVLSLNEGVFPHTAPPNSVIPYNLRKGFGLPTIDNQDSRFASYFDRLSHRAKNVTLVWSSSDANKQAGEMSRFLQQLYYEYPGIVKSISYTQTASTKSAPEIHSEKNQEVMAQLSAFELNGDRALSPSALSTYIECPLRFYFKYLAGAKEPDDISEELDPRIFGNLFHQTVEALYRPFVNKEVSGTEIEQIARLENIRSTLSDIFTQNVPFIRQTKRVFADLQGKNSLVFEVLMRYLTGFFKSEAENAPFYIKALEANMSMVFETPAGRQIKLGGNIDRLDEKEGITRVIDYKTGQGTNRISAIEDLFDTSKHSNIKAIFQTLLYSLMVNDKNTPAEVIQPSVVWMRKLFTETDTALYLQPPRKGKETLTLAKVGKDYREELGRLLDELFDPRISFKQTEHEKNCEYCIYREICLK
jgi:CRISPR/Cas system-associated exonuclease Cas4 (RecB family)